MLQVRNRFALLVLTLAAIGLDGPFAFGQQKLDLFQQGGLDGKSKQEDQDSYQVTASLTAEELRPGADAVLAITLEVPDGFYTYSTNPDMGAMRTRLKIEPVEGLTPLDDQFQPDRKPKSKEEPVLGETYEIFYGKVTWSRRFRIQKDADPAQISVSGTLNGQYCNRLCIPIRGHQFEAKLTAAPQQAAAATPASPQPRYQYEITPVREVRGKQQNDPITWRFALTPPDAKPGDAVTLAVTATLEENWHIYALTQNPKNTGRPIRFDVVANGLKPLGQFQPARPPETKQAFNGKEQKIHHGSITWTRRYQVLPASGEAEFGVKGQIQYQICDPSKCLSRRIELTLGVPPEGDPSESAESPVSVAADASASSGDFGNFDVQSDSKTAGSPVVVVLLMAFAAGFILNFMPCVLPVVGLKVMAFIQQAGGSRGRAFVLNLWYSLGLLSVFLVLATLAVVANLGWGQQFQDASFNVALAAIVFVFALSFLGIWEIPIPGFVSSGKAMDMADSEGAVGAFCKGALTTVLATPCSGPMLGPALTWAVSQPPLVTYTGFAFVGLGMASPYLLIGAFPKLVSFLPKPGAWMETFKHIMGFVLLGTVVYLLTIVAIPYIVPTVAFLMGLWAACWWIGRTPLTEKLGAKVKAWVAASAFATAVGAIAFGWLLSLMEQRFEWAIERELASRGADVESAGSQSDDELPWKPFSKDLLQRLISEKKTVFLDFTADWCLNCKLNEATVLNLQSTKEFFESHGIVPVKADLTNEIPDAKALLAQLGNKGRSIPFYAIFPADNPQQPIVFEGILTQEYVFEKVRAAVNGSKVSGQGQDDRSRSVARRDQDDQAQ